MSDLDNRRIRFLLVLFQIRKMIFAKCCLMAQKSKTHLFAKEEYFSTQSVYAYDTSELKIPPIFFDYLFPVEKETRSVDVFHN